jgi:uncharacterized protein YggE
MRFAAPAAVLLGALALFATPAAADPAHVISVSGTGEARGVPDQAQLSAGVTTVAATADAALAENARKMTAVFAALTRLGVPERAVATSNFSIQPQYPPYDQNERGLQKIVGYQVSNQVDVVLDDPKKLGPALDALVGAGANQINSVSFAIKDSTALDAKAREAAIGDARTRAQTYAKAAGVTLGGVVSIVETSATTSFADLNFKVAGRALAAPATPTAAGEESVRANVTVVFAIP